MTDPTSPIDWQAVVFDALSAALIGALAYGAVYLFFSLRMWGRFSRNAR